jgi:ATP-dependent helicase HepA
MDSKTISGKFSEFFHVTTNQLTIWLNEVLSNVDDSWWQTLVISNLPYPQRQRVERENITSLEQLDLAALVRIMDKNWYQISSAKKFTMHERHYVKAMMDNHCWCE